MRMGSERDELALSIRKHGTPAIMSWRLQHPGLLLDLSRADLTGVDLTGADLTGANLTGARLNRANLMLAQLSEARLEKADLTEAKLPWANLTGADLTGADLTGADLTGANLTGANLATADLTHAIRSGADRTRVKGWAYFREMPKYGSVGNAGFKIGIDPGDATPNDVAEVLTALSDLFRAHGGLGLEFAQENGQLKVEEVRQ